MAEGLLNGKAVVRILHFDGSHVPGRVWTLESPHGTPADQPTTTEGNRATTASLQPASFINASTSESAFLESSPNGGSSSP
ncbi:hypothetical protein A4X06_0g2315 [Tilletia controversa]|uniref:Uncharacterized protein n=2 Tax=Tilletia TaxID=13289 RepID=A0A8X7SYN9_9BASI|nr:hypothetical protein CF328_g1821 [Tilletia controversa]KAE8207316.1 hypothetical protein CF335_g1234 [Tilletia laevis]KAE8252256.1 hypothetical protein A4X06_0g2315 [Tilletia controversa]KAE8264747.1 hypothetical protein A4X03_0g741 [Tilletia caries]